MKARALYDYRDREHARAEEVADDLLAANHTIREARAIYSEYPLRYPYGLHRPGVNIGAMLFLYRQVLAYVPPMTRADFPDRFNISYEVFLQLSDPTLDGGPFIFPILNHPVRYKEPVLRNELSALLLRMPPTWERWHQVLEVTGGTRWFDEADRRVAYPKIWAIPELRQKFRQRLRTSNEAFVSREIKQQIKNNFTDLCLVGMQDSALELAVLSHSDPVFALNDLMYSSDFFAYPKVMGAGGFANVRAGSHNASTFASSSEDLTGALSAAGFDAEVVTALAEGLEFHDIPSISRAAYLVAWHGSGRASQAWELYSSLVLACTANSPTPEELHRAVKGLVHELRDFCYETQVDEQSLQQSSAKQTRRTAWLSVAVSTLLTALGTILNPLLSNLGSVGASIVGASSPSDRDRLVRQMWSRHNPGVDPDVALQYVRLNQHRWRDFMALGTHGDRSSPALRPDEIRNVWWDQ